MDFAGLLTSLIGIVYLLLTIYIANAEDASGSQSGALRWLLYGAVGMTAFIAFNVLLTALAANADLLMPPDMSPLPAVSLIGVLFSTALAGAAAAIGIAVVASANARALLRRVLPASASYNPDSSVHTTAIVLCLCLLSVVVSQLVLSGGVEGLAESIQMSGISAGEVLFNGILWVTAALLGVGLAIRRAPAGILTRLGLEQPTPKELAIGVIVGLILIGVQVTFTVIWYTSTTPEQIEEQTAAAAEIVNAIDTVGLALLLSLSAAVGEEIFFRGALQPVFGMLPTSLFFAAIHTQYGLTPATFLILVVSLGLGYVRARHNTWVAVVAHFVYNFVPLVFGLPV